MDRTTASAARYPAIPLVEDPELAVLARLAATQFDLPVVLISLVGEHGSWLAAAIRPGVGYEVFGRGDPFHDATLHQVDHPLLVGDVQHDPRFRQSGLVLLSLPIGCYAGMPLLGQAGLPIGAFCVLGPAPRRFSSSDAMLLQHLALVAGTITERQRCGDARHVAGRWQAPERSKDRLSTRAGQGTGGWYPLPACDPLDPDWIELVHPMQRDEIATRWRRAIAPGVPFVEEFRAREDEGTTCWFRISLQPPVSGTDPHVPPRSDGSTPPWSGSLQMVDQLLDAEPAARDPATVDMLTSLVNRPRFQALLDRAVRDAGLGIPFALLCLDLDEFKLVNESLGHEAGDRILREIATRLVLCVRHGDVVGRLGGDEFLVLQSGVNKPTDTVSLGQRIIDRLREPMLIDGRLISVGASIGAALGPRDGVSGERLLHHADLALYRAKQDGRGVLRLFDPTMDAAAIQRRSMHRDLRHALDGDEFLLEYQPILSLRSGRAVCLEALLRWRHAVRGLVPPGAFIPVAESTGLIIPIGEWVLRQACEAALHWPPDVRVAVNLSPRQFTGCDIVAQVSEALKRTGLAPDRLELEITETLPLLDNEHNAGILARLRELGVRLVLDDFGVGYSSLAYLGHFRFDGIKLDRQFVNAMSQPEGLAIARAIIGLAASLGSAVTAEGIETTQQLRKVIDEGCDDAQGYWIARPMAAEHIAGTLNGLEPRFHAARDAG